MLIFFWAVSMIRVVFALVKHETFDTEGSLAFLGVVLIPWFVTGRDAGWLSRGRERAHRVPLRVVRANERKR